MLLGKIEIPETCSSILLQHKTRSLRYYNNLPYNGSGGGCHSEVRRAGDGEATPGKLGGVTPHLCKRGRAHSSDIMGMGQGLDDMLNKY